MTGRFRSSNTYFCFDHFIEPSHLSELFEIHRRLLFPPEVVWTKGKIPKTGPSTSGTDNQFVLFSLVSQFTNTYLSFCKGVSY